MSKVAEILNLANKDTLAGTITQMFVQYDQDRQGKIAEWKELRNYLFATSTKTTSNQKLPWKNSTTIPKLTQIRDNLNANYNSALFSSDDWLEWEAATNETLPREKAKVIEDFMKTKILESGFEQVIEKLLLDYIDTGNCFAEVIYVNDVNEQEDESIVRYRGAKIVRISPYDIVFNPTAESFKDTWKITRYVKSMGEIKDDIDQRPDLGYSADAYSKLEEYRGALGGYSMQDINIAEGYTNDGFGNYGNYLDRGYTEILEFEGDIHDTQTGEFLKDQLITILDRKYVLRSEKNPSWLRGNKSHIGWRERSDNIYGMGPLDNLVGLQYRLDHLENLKADALDLTIHPIVIKKGEVEDFTWQPGEIIEIPDADGSVETLAPNAAAFQVNNEIMYIEATMESMAGAPKEAMGIRSPGEKTAFEVQQLANAAGRIFQDKIRRFEKYFVEDLLNTFLEVSRRNLDGIDIVRSVDESFGAVSFIEITKEDIIAKGRIRPVGSRHFSAQAQFMQNMQGIVNSPIMGLIQSHVSTKKLAEVVGEFMGWDKKGIISENVGIAEQAEQQQLVNEMQAQIQQQEMTPNPMEGGSEGEPLEGESPAGLQ